MHTTKYIGIDIGGTKIQVGVVQDGVIVQELRFETSTTASKEQILAELASHLETVVDAEVAGIGIGAPGLVDEENGIVYKVQNIPSWQEVHLKQYLTRHFDKPVYLTNDANAFAVGEKMYGQGQPFANLVGLALGTGFGAGIIINHDVYSGVLSSAGEFGCIPYRDKTLEDYCSGKFFTQQTGRPGAEWHALAAQGNAEALNVLTEYGRHLGNAIKIILFAMAPQAIFLGGSVSKCFNYFRGGLYESLQEFPFQIVTEQLVIAPSAIENVAVLGAAALCKMKQELLPTPLTMPSL
ncbi:ROK family protein [Hymenobacter sp. BT186]|uniref:ROK family protein n=1 Tax=Hymenobacter telluris TaxID=2816474 RepID=A0A939EWP5_9BACT|nr:ROK family protein [Hymenobacter telluris]MBO0358577.1 ROK family protein [Hymenobacter telluris]MBW3374603.1 ROK family protein [Hymenobacter norwichensis]